MGSNPIIHCSYMYMFGQQQICLVMYRLKHSEVTLSYFHIGKEVSLCYLHNRNRYHRCGVKSMELVGLKAWFLIDFLREKIDVTVKCFRLTIKC